MFWHFQKKYSNFDPQLPLSMYGTMTSLALANIIQNALTATLPQSGNSAILHKETLSYKNTQGHTHLPKITVQIQNPPWLRILATRSQSPSTRTLLDTRAMIFALLTTARTANSESTLRPNTVLDIRNKWTTRQQCLLLILIVSIGIKAKKRTSISTLEKYLERKVFSPEQIGRLLMITQKKAPILGLPNIKSIAKTQWMQQLMYLAQESALTT